MNKKVVITLSVIMVIIIAILVFLSLPEKQYKVQFSYGNGTTTEVVIKEGEIVTKPAEIIMTGYKFIGWELNGEPFDFATPITNDMTLVAVYEKIEEEKPKVEYTVKFDVDGGTEVSEQKVKEGEKVVKPEDPTKEGVVFDGWTLDGKLYNFEEAVNGNITLKATWKKAETVTVTFDTDGGSKISNQIIEKGKAAKKPSDPTKTGYKFKEWTLNGKAYDFKSEITENITLKASWIKVETVTVTFDTDGGSKISNQIIEKGTIAKKPSNPTKAEHRFKGWTLDGKAYDFNTKLDKNITLKATWEKIEYVIVTFDTDGGNSITAQKIEKGMKATKPTDPTKTGYRFKGWKLNGATYNFANAVTGNITLKAVWEKIEYVKVTFNTDGGSNVAEQKIEKGKTATKPADPTRTGYRFKGWELNGSTYNFSGVVNSDITLKAVWEKIETVTITFNTDGGSNVASQTIEKGKTATKPANPTKDGYTFAGWTLNGAAYNFVDAVNSNITIKATWTQKTFTAKLTNVDNYSTDKYITIYQEGTEIKVSGIYYTNGTRIPTGVNGNKLSVAAAEIEGVTTIKVKLTSGSMVTATIQ